VRKKKKTLEGSDEVLAGWASGSLRRCCGSELPALGMEAPFYKHGGTCSRPSPFLFTPPSSLATVTSKDHLHFCINDML
jgi:hypothetical protein